MIYVLRGKKNKLPCTVVEIVLAFKMVVKEEYYDVWKLIYSPNED